MSTLNYLNLLTSSLFSNNSFINNNEIDSSLLCSSTTPSPISSPVPFESTSNLKETIYPLLAYNQSSEFQINQVTYKSIKILNNNNPNDVKYRTTLTSQINRTHYLPIKILRKTFYGEVSLAYELDYSTFQLKRNVIIKKYDKHLLNNLNHHNSSEENPFKELILSSYLGSGSNNPSKYLLSMVECLEDPTSYFAIFPYCSGGDVIDIIEKYKKLDNRNAKEFFIQLSYGLNYLHNELKVAHRDLSPENIVFDEANDKFMIIDYGACIYLQEHDILGYHPSKNIESLEESDNYSSSPLTSQHFSSYNPYIKSLPIFGKTRYMAPENYEKNSILHPFKLDIWAAGVILFLVLTGIPPLEIANESDDRFNMIKAGRLSELISIWKCEIDPLAFDLISKCLEIDPSKRISVSEILIHPWLNQGDIKSTP